jgi:FlaA1/EpsC-like NDP-sugar epimerase
MIWKTHESLVKRAIMVLLDGAFSAAAAIAALAVSGAADPVGAVAYGIAVVASLAAPISFASLGLYRSILSQMTEGDIPRIALAVVVSGVALALLMLAVLPAGAAMRAAMLYPLFLFCLIGGARLAAYLEIWRTVQSAAAPSRVAIYGAGQAGVQLAAALEHSQDYRPVAFFDDDTKLQGRKIRSLPVLAPKDLATSIQRLRVARILLAIPSLKPSRRQEILSTLELLSVSVCTVPSLEKIAGGTARVSDVLPIDIEELLQRDPIPPIADLLCARVAGKCVMVTGAGGSIGSELCRQIIANRPRCLVLYETTEASLYAMIEELEAKALAAGIGFVPVLANTLDRAKLESVCRLHSVETIYHAAAYQHVPLLERNPIEGVHNNVISTFNVAEVALATGVEAVVLISTDKAVRPTSVMGASKRFSEMIVQALARRETGRRRTKFCIVRFGNVLGSSGSVVPKFRAQIAAGGPLTVTHRDIVRYFMTIPEAAQLVVQASALAECGDVFVLDMGKPVRIYDLASRMVRLSGLSVRDEDTPDGDIAIEITGLRLGEKLYEELLIGDNAMRTVHPRIRCAMEPTLTWEAVQGHYSDLLAAMSADDMAKVLAILHAAIPEFSPSEDAGGGMAKPLVPEGASSVERA